MFLCERVFTLKVLYIHQLIIIGYIIEFFCLKFGKVVDVLKNKFLEQLESLNIQLNEKQMEQFYRYYELLVKWNKVMNLTGITDYEEVNEKHFIDSLSISKVVDLLNINTVIDIGTGAGFPGIPLKIAFPHLKIILLDSLQKRINFLNNIIVEMSLCNIMTLHGRAEDYARNSEYREQFDLCVSRAVANLSVLSEYCIPYVKVGGIFISYKSGNIYNELKQSEESVKVLGGIIENVDKFNLPQSEIERSLITIRKKKNTVKKYPRKAGMPSKNPIGI